MDYIKAVLRMIPHRYVYLIKLYVVGLLCFALLRLVLIFYTINQPIGFNEVFTTCLIGLRFDAFVMAYFVAPPLLLIYFHELFQWQRKVIPAILVYYFALGFPLLIFVTLADIPYFKFFRNRLSEASFQWLDNLGVVMEMIITNPVNLLFLVIALLCVVVALIWSYKSGRQYLFNTDSHEAAKSKIKLTLLFVVCAFFVFMGMRGRLDHPLREGDAFWSDNPVLNQIGLNPVFTIIKSYEAQADLMDNQQALSLVNTYLGIDAVIDSISPIAHFEKSNQQLIKPNIVLVLMESMSANYTGLYQHKGYTPHLDSLAKQSWFFKEAYSAGIHTNNGVFSTLYGFPAIKRTRPMSTIPLRKYSGLPYTLKQLGYTNLFFTSHDKLFDNLGAFLPYNDFDKLYSQCDYPKSEVVGPFGVPDHYLFDFARKHFPTGKQPFFATILTTSNHDPYILPARFKGNYASKDLNAVQYADWSIGQFIQTCKQQPWYENTVFVFIADHGLNVGENPYSLPLSYHHIPFIIHAPKILGAPQQFDFYVQQTDVYPVIMDIIHASYINNTLGIDVMKHHREYVYFSADDKMGCLNNEWLYIYHFGGKEYLHKYHNHDLKNYATEYPEQLQRMKQYAFSQTQASEWLFKQNKTAVTAAK